MRFGRFTHRLASWLALCAILMAALAPAISHALNAAHDASHANAGMEMEICTMQGMEMPVAAKAETSRAPTPDQEVDHFAHCPFCHHHTMVIGLPFLAAAVRPAPAVFLLLPPLFYQASRPPFAWSIRQPRSPPANS